jgi:copper transport protein
LTVAPGHAGPVSVSISLASGDLGALPAKEVTLVLSRPDKGIEPIRREARRIDEAEWRVDGLTLPVAGRWKVAVEVLVSDFDMARLEGTVTIGP